MIVALSHKDVMKISQINCFALLGEGLWKVSIIRYYDEYPQLQRYFLIAPQVFEHVKPKNSIVLGVYTLLVSFHEPLNGL